MSNIFLNSQSTLFGTVKSFRLTTTLLETITTFVYEAVKRYYKRPGGVVGVYGKGHLGVRFYVGRCLLREWVVRGGGLDGNFGEQGLPVGIQE